MTKRNAGLGTAAIVAGVRVDLTAAPEITERLRASFDGTAGFCAVHTLNPEILMQAHRLPEYAAVLDTGTLNVVDGVGLQKALKFRLGARVDRICGADLIFQFAEMAENAGRAIFFIGGQRARLELAMEELRRRYPKLKVEGVSPTYNPDLPLPGEAEIADRIKALQPGVVAVCLGAPRQESWIAQNRPFLIESHVAIAAGLGGTVDFLSGEVPRAPRWIRSIGLEWAFRLIREPWRLKRQASSLPEFALRAMFSRKFIGFRAKTKR
jgi:N-acetylglucosaminyldiphosphoundecaprenol N-acetyl-beta-D-mannosaminyltransferase